jgi:tetratricopeptide (TPR) repeat protein
MSDAPISLSGRYEIVRPLGAGGMGQVFLAQDRMLQRQVAVKLLPPSQSGDEISRERLRREALAAAGLDHPFICKIHEIGESAGQLFIVMEYVAGETVQDKLRRDGPMAVKDAVGVAGEMAEALEEAHARNLVHRDLKPANIILTPTGHVKVMDFGLAKQVQTPDLATAQHATIAHLTGEGIRVGTLAYMSPEQVVGDSVDARSDIFSLGVVLWEMLTGVHPFNRPRTAETVGAILSEAPLAASRAADLPDALMYVIRRMVAKRPADRYPTPGDVRTDLARCSDSGPRAGLLAGLGMLAPADPDELRRTPFAGRADERAELRRLLQQAVNGHGAIVLLGGEPGVGKTRLSEELLREARTRGCLCLVGHCYEMEGAPPYVPFIEVLEHSSRMVPPQVLRETLGDAAPEVARLMPELRRVYPDIPPAADLPPEQQRRFFFNAYREFVQRSCRAGPLVVVMEDLHWADEPTLALFQHVVQIIPTIPLLVIGTYRDVELDTARPFARTLESLLRQRAAVRIPLRRLPESAVADMLAGLAGGAPPPSGLAHAVYSETEGNPFFVEEVFHHLSEEGKLFEGDRSWKRNLRIVDLEVPEGVRLVIGRRLERLGDETRRVLTNAAVIGRSFSLRVLEAIEDQDSDRVLDAIEDAERAHLVAPVVGGREPRYMFAHELIRQTLSGGLSLPRRQRLHLKIADAIERVYAPSIDKHVSMLAHHLYQAGAGAEPGRAGGYLLRAGRTALESAAFEEALAFFDSGLSLEDDLPGTTRADLHDGRASALRSLGRTDDAIEAWQRTLQLLEQEGNQPRIGLVALQLGWTQNWAAQYAAGRATMERGLKVTGEDAPGPRCRLLAALGTTIAILEGYEKGMAMLDEGVRLAERHGDARSLGIVTAAMAMHHWNYYECRNAEAATERMWQAIGELPDMRWNAADSAWVDAYSKLWQGRVEDARAVHEPYEREAERLGHAGPAWCMKILRALFSCLDGHMERALAESRAATEYAQANQVIWRFHSHYVTAAFLSRMGRHAEAIREAREAVMLEPPGTQWDGVSASYLFAILAHAGDAAALDMLPELWSRLPTAGRPNWQSQWRLLKNLVVGLSDLGRQAETAHLYPLVLDRIEARDGILADTDTTWDELAAICAAAAGEPSRAEAHVDRARAQFDAMGVRAPDRLMG